VNGTIHHPVALPYVVVGDEFGDQPGFGVVDVALIQPRLALPRLAFAPPAGRQFRCVDEGHGAGEELVPVRPLRLGA
jgi:hypothetical protein